MSKPQSKPVFWREAGAPIGPLTQKPFPMMAKLSVENALDVVAELALRHDRGMTADDTRGVWERSFVVTFDDGSERTVVVDLQLTPSVTDAYWKDERP